MEEKIQEAVDVLNQGGLVIFPTDTAFGIGCRIDKPDAVRRLFTLRKRPDTQATPVLVSGVEMAESYFASVPDAIKKNLIDRYWPGALTIVLPCKKEKVPELVRGKGENLGVRMPNHATALSLINRVGVPLLGPSANFHGEKTPYTIAELDKELVKLVDFVIEGECSVKEASTVIDCSVSPWKILRQGAIRIVL